MTTAHPRTGSGRTQVVVGPVVRGALLSTLGLGAVALAVAALVSGAPAVLGVAVGLGLVSAYFGLGSLVVAAVAAVAPAASLLVSLLTYVLQVVLAGVVFLALSRSGLLGGEIASGWLAGTVIVGTLVWATGQIVATVRLRLPAFDTAVEATEANVR